MNFTYMYMTSITSRFCMGVTLDVHFHAVVVRGKIQMFPDQIEG